MSNVNIRQMVVILLLLLHLHHRHHHHHGHAARFWLRLLQGRLPFFTWFFSLNLVNQTLREQNGSDDVIKEEDICQDSSLSLNVS